MIVLGIDSACATLTMSQPLTNSTPNSSRVWGFFRSLRTVTWPNNMNNNIVINVVAMMKDKNANSAVLIGIIFSYVYPSIFKYSCLSRWMLPPRYRRQPRRWRLNPLSAADTSHGVDRFLRHFDRREKSCFNAAGFCAQDSSLRSE